MSEEMRKQERTAGPSGGSSGGDEVAGASPARRAGGGAEEGYRGPGRPNRLKRTARPEAQREKEFAGEQRLLMLDTWLRSKLPATEFADLVGVAPHTLYGWRKRFERDGPAGLVGRRKGQTGSRLPEPVRRAILMMKEQHPGWGQDRIHDMLLRSDGLSASPGAIQRVLLEEGYEVSEAPTRPHPAKVTRFEAPRPNAVWQTDLFSFMLKRERRPKGRQRTAQGEISALRAEKKELEKELRRHRTLLRAAPRSVGLVSTKGAKKASSKRRRRASPLRRMASVRFACGRGMAESVLHKSPLTNTGCPPCPLRPSNRSPAGAAPPKDPTTWKEVDLDAGLIARPRHKTGRALRLPMSEPLREILERQPQRSGLVCRGLPKSDSSLYKALHRLMDRAEVPRSGWHHLRHTAATLLAAAGVLLA